MVGFVNRTLSRDELIAKVRKQGGREDAWFMELCSSTRISAYRVRERLYETQTKFQRLELLDLHELGKTLVLDGRIQLSQCDEHIYHEMLVHPAMVQVAINESGPAPLRVLVLGGGDGCVVREVLKWPQVEIVRLVELDDQMIEVFRDRAPDWNDHALSDKRCEVQCRDAIEVLNDDETWDVIIGDLTEPFDLDGTGREDALSDALFGREFLDRIAKKLNPGGVYAAQTGGVYYVPEFDRHHVKIIHDFVEAFEYVNVAMEYVRAYDSCLWTCAFASPHGSNPFATTAHIATVLERGVQSKLRYYNPSTHARLFAQPVPHIYAE
jgi:spermidine synthase